MSTDLRNAMTSLVQTKRGACAREACADLAPMVDLCFADGRRAIAVIPDRDYIVRATEALRAERPGTGVRWLAFVADALIRYYEPDEAPAGERGEVTAAREAGDMSVGDVLAAMMLWGDGTVEVATQPYRYDDRGQPVFAQIEIKDGSGMEGEVIDQLRRAMAL